MNSTCHGVCDVSTMKFIVPVTKEPWRTDLWHVPDTNHGIHG